MKIKTSYYSCFAVGGENIKISVTIRDKKILANRIGNENIFTEFCVVGKNTDYTIDWDEMTINFSHATQQGVVNHSSVIQLTFWQKMKLKWLWERYLIQKEIFWTWIKRIALIIGISGTITGAIYKYWRDQAEIERVHQKEIQDSIRRSTP